MDELYKSIGTSAVGEPRDADFIGDMTDESTVVILHLDQRTAMHLSVALTLGRRALERDGIDPHPTMRELESYVSEIAGPRSTWTSEPPLGAVTFASDDPQDAGRWLLDPRAQESC